MMSEIFTMFSTFVLFVGGVITITEAVNKLFKIEGQMAKLFMSWALSIGLACLGFGLQLGIFADLGNVTEWQGWVKTVFVGVGCAISANKIYDRNEIWRLLQIIFSLFDKDGKAIRTAILDEMRKEKEAKKLALRK